MKKPTRHIFVCTSSRANGQQKGFCHTKDGVAVIGGFIEELEERGLSGEVMVSNTGCFGLCEEGPVVVIYPDNVWYGSVTSDDVETIVEEHIVGGKVVEDLQIR